MAVRNTEFVPPLAVLTGMLPKDLACLRNVSVESFYGNPPKRGSTPSDTLPSLCRSTTRGFGAHTSICQVHSRRAKRCNRCCCGHEFQRGRVFFVSPGSSQEPAVYEIAAEDYANSLPVMFGDQP